MIGEEISAYDERIIVRNKAVAHSEYAKNPTKRSAGEQGRSGYSLTLIHT
jgi:hypothetical protein